MARPTSRLLFLFPHPVVDERKDVAAGNSPTERLYGAEELIQRGWSVAFSDSRFAGVTGRILGFLRKYAIIGIGPRTIRDILHSDVVIVKDEFSVAAALGARLFGRKVVFLDSMFTLPVRWWKVLGTRLALWLAHETVCYSEYQKQVWIARFGAVASRIRVMPYTIDTAFYRRHAADWRPGASRRVLAVGRDVGRDYATLIEALRGTDVHLDLVTLPYLLRNVEVSGNPRIVVHQRLSYDDLFRLYRECGLAVIPLKAGVSYPSGIRALLEAMVMKRPIVATRNEVLEDYMTDGEHGVMVAPGDPAALRGAILDGLERAADRTPAVEAAARLVEERYHADTFADQFEAMLVQLTRPAPGV